jgi:osmotically-inducible protein OsmY
MRTDLQLKKDVEDELEFDPAVTASDIGVSVKDGVVTLTGFVPNFWEKRAAERAAKRVEGVRAIANDIEVRLASESKRSDPEIARSIMQSLEWKSWLPKDRIKVIVEDGWVTLEGQVDWHWQKDAIYHDIRYVTGVKGVTNLISVRPTVRASEVKQKITNALVRNAELDADQVKVETTDGKVILKGKVHSFAERRQAELAAWSAPGVAEVENDIAITA